MMLQVRFAPPAAKYIKKLSYIPSLRISSLSRQADLYKKIYIRLAEGWYADSKTFIYSQDKRRDEKRRNARQEGQREIPKKRLTKSEGLSKIIMLSDG